MPWPRKPAAFLRYLTGPLERREDAAEKAYWKLSEQGEDVSRMEIPGYPATFYHDVRLGYADVVDRYERSLQELGPRRWLFDTSDFLIKRFRGHSQKGP
jgi:hypothetical protein